MGGPSRYTIRRGDMSVCKFVSSDCPEYSIRVVSRDGGVNSTAALCQNMLAQQSLIEALRK